MEQDEDIRTKAVQPDQKRRTFFKAALAASAIPVVSIARVGTVKHPVSWVHGNSATIVGAHNLEMDVMQGNARIVRGRSWSTIPLHFSIPSPGLDRSSSMYISAIWVRMQAEAGAKISGMSLHDCETTLARIDGMNLSQQGWGDVRIALHPPREIVRTIGITLDCEFADVSRQIGISAVGCEFKMSA